jgi:hypothetical protein
MGKSVQEVLAALGLKRKTPRRNRGAPPRKNKGGNNGRKGTRDTRNRYWHSGKLMKRKVRNLVRCCGMTHEAAVALWTATRKRKR